MNLNLRKHLLWIDGYNTVKLSHGCRIALLADAI
jgi:hypothetical protein